MQASTNPLDFASKWLRQSASKKNNDVFTKFMTRLLNHPQVKPLLSDEHFSVNER